MNIEEVSKRTKISKGTLRFWEETGLLPKISRNKSGYRKYTEEEIQIALFIKDMQKVDMRNNMISSLLHLQNSKKKQLKILQSQYQTLTNQKIELEKRMNYLKAKIKLLSKKVLEK